MGIESLEDRLSEPGIVSLPKITLGAKTTSKAHAELVKEPFYNYHKCM